MVTPPPWTQEFADPKIIPFKEFLYAVHMYQQQHGIKVNIRLYYTLPCRTTLVGRAGNRYKQADLLDERIFPEPFLLSFTQEVLKPKSRLEFVGIMEEVKFPTLPSNFFLTSKNLQYVINRIMLHAQNFEDVYMLCAENNQLALPALSGETGTIKQFLSSIPFKLGNTLAEGANLKASQFHNISDYLAAFVQSMEPTMANLHKAKDVDMLVTKTLTGYTSAAHAPQTDRLRQYEAAKKTYSSGNNARRPPISTPNRGPITRSQEPITGQSAVSRFSGGGAQPKLNNLEAEFDESGIFMDALENPHEYYDLPPSGDRHGNRDPFQIEQDYEEYEELLDGFANQLEEETEPLDTEVNNLSMARTTSVQPNRAAPFQPTAILKPGQPLSSAPPATKQDLSKLPCLAQQPCTRRHCKFNHSPAVIMEHYRTRTAEMERLAKGKGPTNG